VQCGEMAIQTTEEEVTYASHPHWRKIPPRIAGQLALNPVGVEKVTAISG